MVAQARDALRKAGGPLHISQLLDATGKHNTKKERVSLSGSLSQYVHDDRIFTRVGPNLFGLKEWDAHKDKDVVELLESAKK